MSSPVGSYGGFVDTQDVVLENVSDGFIYSQARTTLPSISHEMQEHHTCTGYVEKLGGLDGVSLPVTMVVTEPELAALMNLALVVGEQITLNLWRVTYTDFSGNSTNFEGWAKMFELQILDRGSEVVHIAFRLEFESKFSITADKDVIKVT